LLNLNNATDLFPRVSYQLSSSSWSPGKFYPAVKEKAGILKFIFIFFHQNGEDAKRNM
jgi:hypothetical protein